jgi:HTH-type transcriptional regulator/antitoxin HigA
MPTVFHKKHTSKERLPKAFDELVRMMPPQAIMDDIQHGNTLEMVDRLMAAGRLTGGQHLYLETLIQLVQAYETRCHAIKTSDITGLDSPKHLMEQNDMSASDLARLLGMHPSMGSKILKGERSLTVEHLRKLCEHFKVSPAMFID